MRNSVKATVDAYDGTVTLYAFDESDPVLQGVEQGVRRQADQAQSGDPAGADGPPPLPRGPVQGPAGPARAASTSTDAQAFFSGQDFWEVPKDPADADATGPAAVLPGRQVPGAGQPRFQLTAALTPKSRGNLAALMSASDAGRQAQFEILELPTRTRRSPARAGAQQHDRHRRRRRRASPSSASSNSEVIYGNLLTLPVGDGMLYVEPIYLRRKRTRRTRCCSKVLVAYGEQEGVRQQPRRRRCAKLVDGTGGTDRAPATTPARPPPRDGRPERFAAGAIAADQGARRPEAAQMSGDFEAYGTGAEGAAGAIGS